MAGNRCSPPGTRTSRAGTRRCSRRPSWPKTAPSAAPWSSGPTATRCGSACRAEVDARIKAAGAENAYFPLFIPEAYLARGRARRGASAPRSRSSPTPAARSSRSPSSSAHERDRHRRVHGQVGPELPRPAPAAQPVGQRRALGAAPRPPFLRTTEFLWQEGHTAHATEADAHVVCPCASSTTCTRTSW